MTKAKLQLITAIIETALGRQVKDRAEFLKIKREVSSAHKMPMPETSAIRSVYLERSKASSQLNFLKILTRRDVRTLSGVAIVTVLTKPYPCPGKCIYCPTEAIMPKSYLSNEPAAQRALINRFDPAKQVAMRLRAMSENGHSTDKIELIVKGGTWSSYPWKYQKWFIKRVFDAANQFQNPRYQTQRTMLAAQNKNERAKNRIIGLTIETRPDWITHREIVRLRELGVTRVELGVQSVDDHILEITKRGHGSAATIAAAKLLKDAGYKTDFHMMPQLPGATPKSDQLELEEIFKNPAYRPDMIKIYPCVVVELSELYEVWKRGEFTPYPDAELIKMLIKVKTNLPRYVRISRLIRDIPSTSIKAGNMITNLREVIQAEMRKKGLICPCLRCREIGHVAKVQPQILVEKLILFDDEYVASGGVEHFLSFEDARRRAVFGFCRLRLPEPTSTNPLLPETKNCAFVRELHVYGFLVPISKNKAGATQHKGLGKKLMKRAEQIAQTAGYKKLAVIAGIGVREYYRKLGYKKVGTYMIKKI